MKTPRFADSQIVAILKQAEAGSPVPELCREHGITNATFYNWHSKFGGMDASLMARMKELEEEKRCLSLHSVLDICWLASVNCHQQQRTERRALNYLVTTSSRTLLHKLDGFVTPTQTDLRRVGSRGRAQP